ncbi:GNAT family N-acetyltransferase [Duganella sp. FT134W]|uniref:GNAT family N-acetyltransferase n=1 Tax=Duganella margarita TaxID=2692170 RepID=A0A7X4KKT8_9BURK|nr:GNAT family N-acetyltransferase [Duganella margarita]MYM76013.1 GNAT family N-acetyltransferase [Duganella margarita]
MNSVPPLPAPMAQPSPSAGAVAQYCWPGEVPPWTDGALQRLYGNLYATVQQFSLNRELSQAHTYAAYVDGVLHTLLVFSLRDGVIEVFNEVICLEPDAVHAFARYAFGRFHDARVIVLRAVHVARTAWQYPSQQHDYLEDTWVALPADSAAYTASLSKNTRRNLRRQAEHWQADRPHQRFVLYCGAAITPVLVDAIVDLNHARMARQRKQSALDAAETARIKQLAASCGTVGVITVDGKVCAGAISFQVGANHFLSVLAHDPAYDRYGLGFLCCHQMICACIDAGGREFHFLWGRYEYKRSFLGKRRELDRLLLYRTPLDRLRYGGLGLRVWWAAQRRRAHLWLFEHRQHAALRWVRARLARGAVREEAPC